MKGIIAAIMRLPKAALGGIGAAAVGTTVVAATMLGGTSNSATLQVLTGTVQVQSNVDDAYRSARSGEVLQPVATVRTGPDGRAQLKFFDGSLTRLNYDTTFSLRELSGNADGERTILSRQTSGRTFNRVKKLTGSGSRVEVKTPNATASVRGTDFEVAVEENGDSTVKVFPDDEPGMSKVVVTSNKTGQQQSVQEGEKVTTTSNGEMTEVTKLTQEDQDEWKQFNDCLDGESTCEGQPEEDSALLTQATAAPLATQSAAQRVIAAPATDAPVITETPVETTEPEETEEPTPEPTPEPLLPDPTEEPQAETPEPTATPTVEPTIEPTVEPTIEPTIEPTVEPTIEPTVEPPPPSPGSVSGVVRDAVDGAPIPGATIAVEGTTSTTDPSGVYTIADLPPGAYELTASAPNYDSASQNATVESDQVTAVDFDLNPQDGSVVVTVVDLVDGTPIGDASVEVGEQMATTGSDGTAVFSSVPASRTHDVRASKDEYVANNSVVSVDPGGSHSVTIPLRLADDITGLVTDEATGAPIAGATVSVEGTDRQATTAGDGRYALTGLAASETPYTVSAGHADYISKSAPVTVAPNATTTADFALEKTPGRVFGKVTDARPGAEPIEGAAVVLVGTDLGTTTDANGDYDFPRVAPGDYRVKATADGYFDQDNEANVTVTKGAGSEANLSLQPQPGTVTVNVISVDGPMGANVSLGGGDAVATGEDGTHTFEDVAAADDYALVVSHPEFETLTDSVDVGPGEDVTRTYALTLKPGTVAITVQDEAGNGVAGADVTFHGSTQTTTSESATVTFTDVAPGGGQTVAVTHPDYEPVSDSIDVAPGATVNKTYNLTAKPGTITVNVTGFGGGPLNANVALDGGASQAIGSDGTIEFNDVAAGTHTVTASHPDYETEDAQTFTLAPNGSETRNFALDPKPGSITVKATGFGGSSLDAQVSLDGADPTATGSDGTHTFAAVPAGTHSVSVTHPDYESVGPRTVSLAPNGTATESFALTAKTGSIHGFVRDAETDEAIDGASVTLDAGAPDTASGGEFTFDNVAPGDHIVRATASPTHVANNVSVSVAPNGDHEVVVLLNAAPGGVAGLVRDQASDAPIAGATVSLVGTTFTSTTDADGAYSMTGVPRGPYTLRVAATDFVTEDVSITVSPGAQTTQNLNLAKKTGRVAGTVKDAVSGDPINGANLDLNGASATSGVDGAYAFEAVPVGTYTLTAAAVGFESTERSVTVEADQTETIDMNLSPAIRPDGLEIRLTWNAEPEDLDSHLWLPSTNKFHVYYGQRGSNNSCPYAQLDGDDTNGRGPETITISRGFTGSYRYAVQDYRPLGLGGNVAGSGASVQIFDRSVLRASFDAPAGGSGKWWHVFNLDFAPGSQTWVIHSVDRLRGSSPAPYSEENGGSCSS